MARHPGDPRADYAGEIPYEESEYPHHTYTPPALPPEPGNVHNFIPGRGQAQHGVQIDRRPENVGLPYAGEQAAIDKYLDPEHAAVRDLEPPVPVPVSIVNDPDLTRRVKGRASAVSVPADGVFRRIVGSDHMRTRVMVRASATDFSVGSVFYWSHDSGALQTNAFRELYQAGAANVSVVDSDFTAGLFAMVPLGFNPVTFMVWSEYTMLDGQSLT